MVLLSRSIAARNLRKAAVAAAAPLGLALLGCGGAVAQFEPVHPSGRSAVTYPVSSYELKVGPYLLGHAVVWSRGASEDVSANDGHVLDLEIAIRNATHSPLNVDVDHANVSVTLPDGRTQSLGVPRFEGSRTIAPDASGQVALHYAVPRSLALHDVKSFEFNWRVASATGDYTQSTAFVPTPLAVSDDLNDPGLACNRPYGPVTADECIDARPPLVSLPLQ
jgi:hypothetical protein